MGKSLFFKGSFLVSMIFFVLDFVDFECVREDKVFSWVFEGLVINLKKGFDNIILLSVV